MLLYIFIIKQEPFKIFKNKGEQNFYPGTNSSFVTPSRINIFECNFAKSRFRAGSRKNGALDKVCDGAYV